MRYWKWRVIMTYNENATLPHVAGEVLKESHHEDDFSKDVEVQAASQRDDIDIQVLPFTDSPNMSREEALDVIRGEMPRRNVHALFRNLNRRG